MALRSWEVSCSLRKDATLQWDQKTLVLVRLYLVMEDTNSTLVREGYYLLF